MNPIRPSDTTTHPALTPHPRTAHPLNACDKEPIHQIAAVQTFGALIKLNRDWSIAHRSVNCCAVLGLEDLPAVGTKLADLFTTNAMNALQASLAKLGSGSEVGRIFGIGLIGEGTLFDCAVHCLGERIVIEFESHNPDEFVNHLSLISPMIAQLEAINEVDKLCTTAARIVRTTLGYDRVMVYKFHEDESGEVIAEDARGDLEPYLGLRYPRTDIPQQARALLVRNRVRVIAGIEAPAAAIEPALAFGNRPLDMSLSVLRTHSDVHLRYLRNMVVRATLTISILRQGKLWGLISCHHTQPKVPSFSLRTVAETLGQMLYLILDRMLIDQPERLRSRGRELFNQLMVNFADGASLHRNLAMLEVVLQMTYEIARERQRAQEQQELLIAELNHRVRNILNLIRSLVSQSRHDAISVESLAAVIGGRIAALASAHDNITR
ncbi:MAG: GAF domain-containing protein [Pseudomonadota bacterium]